MRPSSAAGKLAWYEQPANPTDLWIEHVISSAVVGPMSLDVADLDGDGDMDVAVGEHNTSNPSSARLWVFTNTGGALSWEQQIVDTGYEHHDGVQIADFDNDGKPDIMSIGWTHSNVVVYRNVSSIGGIAPLRYTLTFNVVGNGTVTAVPAQAAYDAGQQITMTAIPASGWVFVGWSGDATGSSNPLPLVMNGNKSVTATFTKSGTTSSAYLPYVVNR